ncbi:hypothetical protein ZWY2020_025431 [Hordeum vulgare]|nr:hypothetical protein ZWY2020_025431 [Hordeum vulgare]
MAGGGLSGGAAAFWTTGALEVVKQNDSPGLLWKRIKLTTTHKNNAKKRLLAGNTRIHPTPSISFLSIGCYLCTRRFDLLGAGPTAPSKPSAHTRQLVAAMQQHTSNLADLVENLLTRFDEEKLAAEKCMEIQAAFNTHVSHELQSPSKQIGLTQADVDDVHKVASPSASPTPPARSDTTGLHTPLPKDGPQRPVPTPPPEPRAAPPASALPTPHALAGGQPFARLVNEGPPVMARPEQAERTHLQNPREEYFTKPPKHDFP